MTSWRAYGTRPGSAGRGIGMTPAVAFAAFVVALAIALIPVVSNHFISLNDVYNHVARAPVLAHYDQTPAYQTYWELNWRLVPYLGFDLAALGLLPWFSLGAIVKIMVAGTFAAMFGGAMLLSRAAHGRWSLAVLPCVLLLLNRTLLAGFINFLFGVGIALLGAAVWVALRDRGAPLRLLVLAAFATVLSVIHLFACGVLGVIVVGIELGAFSERRGSLVTLARNVIAPALAFIPAFLLTVFAAPHPAFHIAYKGLGSRFGAFAVPLTYAPIAEAVGLALVGAVIVALWTVGRVTIDRRLAVAAALLFVVQMMMPAEIGAATVVDHRIPIAFWLVLFCALDLRLQVRPAAIGFALLVALVLASRVAIVQTQWAKDNVIYADASRAFASLPGTARVAAAYPPSGLDSATRPAVALYYMPALAFVPRGGFTQILWTIPDQHPLTMRPQFEALTRRTEPDALWQLFVPGSNVDRFSAAAQQQTRQAIREYDYIAFLNAEPFSVDPKGLLELVSEGPGTKIYRVLHGRS